jgi:hypothetical protein
MKTIFNHALAQQSADGRPQAVVNGFNGVTPANMTYGDSRK